MQAFRVRLLPLVAGLLVAGCFQSGTLSGELRDILPPPEDVDQPDVSTGDLDAADADAADVAAGDADADAAVGDAEVDAPDGCLDCGDVDTDAPETVACVPGEHDCCLTDDDCFDLHFNANLCGDRWVCQKEEAETGICGPATVENPCQSVPGNAPPCWEKLCDPASGGCRLAAQLDGKPCPDDGDPCTVGEHCEVGACVASGRLVCDDHNACTLDMCDAGECRFEPQPGAACDDGSPCTIDDACTADGTCVGPTSVCECGTTGQCLKYDDGNPCNGIPECFGGKCVIQANKPVACPQDDDPCTVHVCDKVAGSCTDVQPAEDGIACDDGDRCTVGDHCEAGACVPGEPLACDDGPCFTAACDPAKGVCKRTDLADATACTFEPGSCFTAGVCASGACVPDRDVDAGPCACTETADCGTHDPTDDPDAGTHICVKRRCVIDPLTVAVHLSAGPCREQRCTPGECVSSDIADTTACDDGDPCTSGETCLAGECAGGAACGAASGACSLMTCSPTVGCVEIPVGVACDSDNLCASGAACNGGACVDVGEMACPPAGTCVEWACDPGVGACIAQGLDAACDDGDPCTEGDFCSEGACRPGKRLFCDDLNPCTDDACGPAGTCVFTPNTWVCDDGNPCTLAESCQDGACVATPSVCACAGDGDCAAYDDGKKCNGTLVCQGGKCVVDPVTVIHCDPTKSTASFVDTCLSNGSCAVKARADGVPCDDGDACTIADAVAGGACLGLPIDCDDENPCTDDTCTSATGCLHTPVAEGDCDDGNDCTTGDTCVAGVCAGGASTCECTTDANCSGHDDADQCNGRVKCVDGSCRLDTTTMVTCPASADPCAVARCDPASGACVTVPVADGAPCSDGSACTTGETCTGGVCGGGTAVTCEHDGACATPACRAGTGKCGLQPVAGECDDGEPLTSADACTSGACLGTNAYPCDDAADCAAYEGGDDQCAAERTCGIAGCETVPGTEVVCDTEGDTPCAYHACDPGSGECDLVTLSAGMGCEDGDACTAGEVCDEAGACAGGAAKDCDDGNPCTADICDPAIGCVNAPLTDGAVCEGADLHCITAYKCQAGVCVAGPPKPTCLCSKASDCDKYQPTDKCDGLYVCTSGKCKKSPATVCVDTNPSDCKLNECVASTGLCQASTAPGNTPCDDGNVCTSNDRCVGVYCSGDAVICDDGNPCTAGTCDKSDGSCQFAAVTDGTACDDGDPCTKPDQCAGGECVPGGDLCGCTTDANCAVFDDGDKCNGIWRCVDEHCAFAPQTAVTCADPDPFDCQLYQCQQSSGQCVFKARPDAVSCDDGTVCTSNDHCQAGECVGTIELECVDEAPDDCLDVVCHPVHGICVEALAPNGGPCDDHNACTTGDFCAFGTCSGEPVDCDDGNPCTTNVCSAELGCLTHDAFGACDDGDPCTAGDSCTAGVCDGAPTDCVCTGEDDCQLFDDGDACNGTVVCGGTSLCVAVEPVVCEPDPAKPCVDVACDPGTGACEPQDAPDGRICDDGDPCTAGDRCQAGVCVGAADPCDDGNSCTTDTCAPETGCVHVTLSNGVACDDGVACNGDGACSGGVCIAGSGATCPCTSTADCAAFEDGDLCNGTLECGAADQCQVSLASLVACPLDPSGCVVETCDPATGACVPQVAPDGAACNDQDPCTTRDVCQAGLCLGQPIPCQDDDPCTEDTCDPYFGCVHRFAAQSCTTNACLKDGTCTLSSMKCVMGASKFCDDANVCTKDSCSVTKGGCVFDPLPANGDPCGSGKIPKQCYVGSCQAGACSEMAFVKICNVDADCQQCGKKASCTGSWTCSADKKCVVDLGTIPSCGGGTTCMPTTCDPATGTCPAVAATDGTPCDDGDLCTEGDACQAGVCVGTPKACQPATDPCQEYTCLPSKGCALQQASKACDDAEPCTADDRCIEGACVGQPALGPAEDFDDGDISDWTVSSTGQVAGWSLGGAVTSQGPLALYAGNAGTATIEDPAGGWHAEARMPAFLIPGDALTADLSFQLWMDVTEDACGTDELSVVVNDSTQYARCDGDGQGFTTVTVNLAGSFTGDVVDIVFVFDAASGQPADGVGAFVDDVRVDWICPL